MFYTACFLIFISENEYINQTLLAFLISRMGLTTTLSLACFYIKSKIIKGGEKICFFNFWAVFLKMYIFQVVTLIFFSPSAYSINSIFSGSTYL